MAEEQELDPQEDRRADLEAAIEAAGFEDSADTVSESPDTPSVSPAVERTVSEQAAPNLDTEVQQPEAPRRVKGPTAPIDWPQDLRDEFGSLPEKYQRQIHQQEVRVNQAYQQSAEARRFSESFVRTVEPFRALLIAEGVKDPMQAVSGLLETAAVFRMGSPTQKVNRMVKLIQEYGLMEHIDLLDKGLAGKSVPESDEEKYRRIVQQEMRPITQQFEQEKYWQEQQVKQVAEHTVGQMRQDPQFHLMDAETGYRYNTGEPVLVRHVMADFVDKAKELGMDIPLDQVYRNACNSIPHIAQQFYQQQSGGFMQGQQQRLDTKRNAASSIVGRASSGSNGAANLEGMSLRDTIAAQMSGGGRI